MLLLCSGLAAYSPTQRARPFYTIQSYNPTREPSSIGTLTLTGIRFFSVRSAIWYGNGTKTSCTYDPLTYRLRRLLTVKLSTNEKLQDLYYYYDPVGNITRIKDDAQQTLFYSNSMISPDLNYVYDGLYRLIVASGRERIPQYGASPGNNWNDGPRVQHASMQWDGTRLQTYIDAYFYDDVGNRTFVAHQAGVDGGYSTVFSHTGNRLDVTYVVNDSTFYYNYDSRGNLISLPHIPVMTYNRQNELWYAQVNDGMYNQYSGGQRIRKTVLKTGGIREERIYLGSYELYRKYDSTGAIDIERSTVHVSDDTGRIAMYEALNTSYNSDGADALLTRYIYSNHLGSASLELNETGDIISYEEYHPY